MEEYISFEQIPFGSDNFADNPEPRCPCVLLLDTSGSMGGMPIMQLNEGVRTFKQELQQDPLATKRVEVALVTFGPVSIESDFHTVPDFHPRELETTGDTPMGEAILTGIDMIIRRKKEYKENGIAYYKPWIILITDGSPTDDWAKAAAGVHAGESAKSFAFFAIGVESANMEILKQISVRAPLKLKGLMFREFFMWLSASMKMVSSKNPGSNINLLPPSGWSEL
ncbi:MAG: VWA domain-containing protein [Taibaiella sp.]|nr:VWA domain-containing protein [Taibaiella sp.]